MSYSEDKDTPGVRGGSRYFYFRGQTRQQQAIIKDSNAYLVHTVAEPTHYIRWVSNIAHVNMGYHTIFQNWYNIKRLYY